MSNKPNKQTHERARKGNNDFPEKLTRLREEAGMTQEQASTVLQVNRSTYAYYETGKSHPKFPMLQKISRVYGVSLDYLLGTEQAVVKEAPAAQLQDETVPYVANNQQAAADDDGRLGGRFNDSIADLTNDERLILFRLRIMDKKRQKQVIDYINSL